MTDTDRVEEELRQAITRSLVPLQTGRTVDAGAFGELERLARLVAVQLKGQQRVRKSLLNELYVSARIIRAEAPYIKGHTEALVQIANRLETVFGLILRDESPDDRKPGVPRII